MEKAVRNEGMFDGNLYKQMDTSKPIKITSDFMNQRNLESISVDVDFETGDVSIKQNGEEILSVIHNLQTKKVEVRQKINGEVKVIDALINEIAKYQKKLEEKPLPMKELDEFCYKYICNYGYAGDGDTLLKYSVSTRKCFWQFFNQYIKLRFGESYKEDLISPEFHEIEQTILQWDVKEECGPDFLQAQGFAYVRQKLRQENQKKE